MNPNSLYPRPAGVPSAFTSVPPHFQPVGNAAPISWNAGTPIRVQPASIAIISSGEWPFDQDTLEAPHLRPQAPFGAIYCNQLQGDTPTERGRALLDEVKLRRASGEFGPQTLVVLMLHGTVENGELMLGDSKTSFSMPAVVLLNELARDCRASDATLPVAPILLSTCHAEWIAGTLNTIERPVLINGGRHVLVPDHVQAVLQACVHHADNCWREGRAVLADTLFDTLSSVSAEALHLQDRGEWTEHRLLESCASLYDIDPRQAGLHVDAMLDHGSADELAESLLLFGLAAYRRIAPSIPPLHRVIDGCAEELFEKVQLLLAIGEDVNEVNDHGITALHLACNLDPDTLDYETLEKEFVLRRQLIRLLRENGADPDITDEYEISPADLANQVGEALASLFALDAGIEVRPLQRTQRLIAKASQHGWESVLSLLADPQQAMEVDGDDPFASEDDSSDAATPDQIRENSDS